MYTRDVQTYPRSAGVNAGFRSDRAVATSESTESQDLLIKPMGSVVVTVCLE